MQAANELLSDREANEAYLAADKGRSYLIYFPAGGTVKLDLTDAKGILTAHWINIDTGEFGPKNEAHGGGKLELSPPGKENWAAAIVAQQ